MKQIAHLFLEGESRTLKSNVHNLNIDKLKNLPTNLNNLKSKVDKLDVNHLVLPLVDLNKLCDEVKKMSLKSIYIMIRLKILKIKHLVFLT